MLINDLSEISVKKALEKYLDTSKKKRADERMKFVSYYEGMIGEMESDLKSYFTDGALSQVPLVAQNITSKIINSRCIVYKNPPKRDNVKYQESTISLDTAMLNLERLTYLLGSMGLRSKFNEEEGKVEYDLLTEFYPLFRSFEQEPVAILYPLYSYESSQLGSEDLFAFWSEEEHYLMNAKGETYTIEGNDQRINPYGVIPVTYAHRRPLTTDWFREGASDVISMNETVNVMLTEMSLGMRLQALGQPVATGIDDDSAFQLGVDNIITLPEGATFSFQSPSSSLAEYVESIRFFVDSVAYNNNLKTKWSKGKDTVLSGESLKMLEVDLTESLKTDTNSIWRNFEKERFIVDKSILKFHNINVGEENSVDFSEPRFPMSEQDKREHWKFMFEMGLANHEDYYREHNPDASEAEIAKMVSRVSENLSSKKAPKATPQVVPQAIPQVAPKEMPEGIPQGAEESK